MDFNPDFNPIDPCSALQILIFLRSHLHNMQDITFEVVEAADILVLERCIRACLAITPFPGIKTNSLLGLFRAPATYSTSAVTLIVTIR